FKDALATVWIPLSSLPYFTLYARDLRAAGYRHRDVVRVYALNLALTPVVAAGVARSIWQGLTGRKSSFGRTPKVASRSVVPSFHAFVQLAFPVFFFVMGIWDLVDHRWSHALFSCMNGLLFSYALTRLLGLRDMAQDLVASRAASMPERAAVPVVIPDHR